MAEPSNDFEQGSSTKRVITSRKNTPEERRRQRQEWRKKKQEQKMANFTSSVRIPTTTTTTVQQEDNHLVPADIPKNQESQPTSSKQCLAPNDVKKSRVEFHNRGSGEAKRKGMACSRGVKMVHMALDTEQRVTFKQKPHQKLFLMQAEVNNDSKIEPKELSPEHLEYFSESPVGCGTFGQCFRGRYRNIEVVVKQMIHKETIEDQERARRNLLHEAKVISALGDHPNLPMIFGVVTKSLPLCLVTQFHGVKEESITLHQAAAADMLNPSNCIAVFQKICSALCHMHSKGYLHNDLKADNVVLERVSGSEELNPVVIDFGKSVRASSVQAYRKGNGIECSTKRYLAPEVRSERRYSAASDVYSLGRMLKAISCVVGFYQRVRELVKDLTKERPSDRPSLDFFTRKISEISS